MASFFGYIISAVIVLSAFLIAKQGYDKGMSHPKRLSIVFGGLFVAFGWALFVRWIG